jgi:outer membrane protein TolC
MRSVVCAIALLLLGGARARAEIDGLTLAEACARAFAISEAVHTAEENVREARTRHRGALTLIGPQIALQASGFVQNRIESSDVVPNQATGMLELKATTPQPLLGMSAGATLIQPIFRRSLFPARTAAQHGVESSEAALRRTREQVTLDVTEAFVAILRDREEQRVDGGAVTRAESTLALARGRIKAGGSLPSAEPLAAVSVEAARVRLARSDGALRADEATFQQLVLPATPDPAALAQALDLAQRRSDLQAAGSRVLQSRSLESSLAGSILWPKLDLTGTYSYSYPAEFGVTHSWNASAVLTVPLLQSGDEWTQLKLQSIETEIRTLDKSLLGKQITEDVRRAAADVEVATRVAKLAQSQLEAAQRYYDLIERQLKLGAVSFLEVTISQNTLTDAEHQRVAATFDRELAVYRLLFASGSLRL